MTLKPYVVALIPARGGSKAIPRKNLVMCGGKPLIAHTIDAALNASSLSRIIVSTDDSEIARVSLDRGIDVPFTRPAELAQDDTPIIAVLVHLLDWLLRYDKEPDAIVLLQPTSPLRRADHIDEAVGIFFRTNASSVVSVVEVPHQYNPVSVLSLENDRLVPYLKTVRLITRRQDKPRVYARNGPAIVVCRPDTIRKHDLYGDYCVPYFMDRKDSLDVDDWFDLMIADLILRKV